MIFRASELYVDDPHPGDRIPVKIVISLPNMACECKCLVILCFFIESQHQMKLGYYFSEVSVHLLKMTSFRQSENIVV